MPATTTPTIVRIGSNMADLIDNLMEELIYLDEVAGELDPDTNARIERERVALKQQIIELEKQFPEVDRDIGFTI